MKVWLFAQLHLGPAGHWCVGVGQGQSHDSPALFLRYRLTFLLAAD